MLSFMASDNGMKKSATVGPFVATVVAVAVISIYAAVVFGCISFVVTIFGFDHYWNSKFSRERLPFAVVLMMWLDFEAVGLTMPLA